MALDRKQLLLETDSRMTFPQEPPWSGRKSPQTSPGPRATPSGPRTTQSARSAISAQLALVASVPNKNGLLPTHQPIPHSEMSPSTPHGTSSPPLHLADAASILRPACPSTSPSQQNAGWVVTSCLPTSSRTHVRLQAKLHVCSPLARRLVHGNIVPSAANHPRDIYGVADSDVDGKLRLVTWIPAREAVP